MRVLGISVITNMAAGMLPQKLTEEEVMETGRTVRQELTDLILAILDKLEV
jgi:purine-nucleoside phosphorylase